MTIKLPDEIAQAVDELSKASGEPADRIVISALRAHFPPVNPQLLEEFESWEQASEEDAARLDSGGPFA